jgi:hypothetical protein
VSVPAVQRRREFGFVIRGKAGIYSRSMRSVLLLIAAIFALLAAPLRAADSAPTAASGEFIIITGGVSMWIWEKWKAQPHDNWWMNFVRASRLRIEEIENQVPGAQITWLVYRPAYIARSRQDSNDLIGHIQSVRDAYHVKLVFFDRTEELIAYLNSGQDRSRVKIADLEYFGHSNKACWMFDYSNNIDSASKVWLHENDLSKIRRGLFSRDAFVKSWSCHTGESMSGRWRSAVGVPMIGAIGKTQYMTDELPVLSSPNGRWTR